MSGRGSCPVCSEELRRGDLVLCQTCAAPHHGSCWQYNKGCGVYGCHCRAFTRPLSTPAEAITFSFRRQISMFSMMALGTTYLLGLFLLLPFVPPGLAEAFFGLMSALFAGAVVLVGAPTALRTTYRLLPDRRVVTRTVLLGPLPVRRDPEWLHFDEVSRLEVHRQEVPRYHRNETGSVLELGLRDASGDYVPLATYPWELEDQLLEKAETAAELVGTSVRVPLALPPSLTLSPAVTESLRPLAPRELPAPVLEELPEEPGAK